MKNLTVKQYLVQQKLYFQRCIREYKNLSTGMIHPNAPISYPEPYASLFLGSTIEWDLEIPDFPEAGFLRSPGNRKIGNFPAYPEYWCHINFDGYRDAFLSYLKNHWKVDLSSMPAGLSVDHVFSKGLARRVGFNYVLMALVPRSQNNEYGWAHEERLQRYISDPNRPAFSLETSKTSLEDLSALSYLSLLKIFGIPYIQSAQDYEARRIMIAREIDQIFGLRPSDGYSCLNQLDKFFRKQHPHVIPAPRKNS